jgi:chromosome segregation ATPase
MNRSELMNRAQLLAQRQDECAAYEEGIRKRTAALDVRERSIAKQEAALQTRELECAAKEAELLETGQKMNVAAENIRAQWDHFMKERTEAEEAFRAAEARLTQTQAQVQAREGELLLPSWFTPSKLTVQKFCDWLLCRPDQLSSNERELSSGSLP